MTSAVATTSPSLLAGTNAPGQGFSLFDSGDGPAAGDLFSQLLGNFDSGQGQNSDTPPQATKDVVLLTKTSALLAQETAVFAVAPTGAPKLAELLARPLTPEDATKLLATLNISSADSGGGESPLQQQLKEQLTQLSQASEPQTVAQIIEALPAVQEAASIPVAANTESLLPRAPEAVKQVLRLLQGAISKTRDLASAHARDDGLSTTQESSTQDAALQSLQAANFRAVIAADAPAPVAAKEEKTDTRATIDGVDNVIVVTPLVQQVVVPQWVNDIAPSPIPVRADLDTVIPPLSAGLDSKPVLPQVELPTAALSAEVPLRPEPVAQRAAEQVNNLVVLGDAKPAREARLTTQTTPLERDDSSIAALTNPSATGGHTPTQSAQAVQPTAVTLPPGAINHAPVAEQVHVAVARASKEGVDQITIQLNPEHLGRVEVKLHTNADGYTQITFLADRPDTFDALSRDARSLEATLQESGIKADAGSMQFNLRQQPQPQPQLNSNLSDGRSPGPQASAEDESESAVAAVGGTSVAVQQYRINIHDGVDIHA